MSLPLITFTNWTRWTDRTRINGVEKPGVYVLAHFAKPPSTVELQTQEIIYIGETCGQSLRQRWGQFHRCAFEGKDGHSGGITYWRLFNGKDIERLFVTAFSVDGLNDQLCPLFIRYVERKLILEYAVKWGIAPKCNRK
jgi:hypothetical protein